MIQSNSFPDFIVAGAGKAGTSWLHACCKEHPEIYLPQRKKEIDFFSKFYMNGAGFYQAYFPNLPKEKISGDFSPTYMISPDVPNRIYSWNANCKILFLLRNPIERAYSHYCMHLKGGKVSENVSKELVPGTRYINEGYYFQHISHYKDVFPQEQIRIFLYDDLCQNPKYFLETIFSALGVNIKFIPSLLYKKYHERKFRPKFQNIYNLMVSIATGLSEHSKTFRNAYAFARKTKLVNIFHRFNRGKPFPPLPQKCRCKLAQLYKRDIQALERTIGRDLSKWFQ